MRKPVRKTEIIHKKHRELPKTVKNNSGFRLKI